MHGLVKTGAVAPARANSVSAEKSHVDNFRVRRQMPDLIDHALKVIYRGCLGLAYGRVTFI